MSSAQTTQQGAVTPTAAADLTNDNLTVRNTMATGMQQQPMPPNVTVERSDQSHDERLNVVWGECGLFLAVQRDANNRLIRRMDILAKIWEEQKLVNIGFKQGKKSKASCCFKKMNFCRICDC